MKTREPTAEEVAFLKAANERLKGTGFTAAFQGVSRPYRLVRTRSYLRYFETMEQLEAYADKVLRWEQRVAELNVQLKMFDTNFEAKMIWSGNRSNFRLTQTRPGRSLVTEPYVTIEGLETAVHRIIRRVQAA